MPTTKTTLGGPVDASPKKPGDDLVIAVASATGFATTIQTPHKLILIDSEFFVQTAGVNGLAVPVRRGAEATTSARHASGAEVIVGDPSDFASSPTGTATAIPYSPTETRVTYSAAGAIAVPTTMQNQFVELVSGAASAMTLADPTDQIEGVEMTIIARDAQAYTVTSAGGFNGGGGGADVATFGGAIGDNIRIRAQNRLWVQLYAKNVTTA